MSFYNNSIQNISSDENYDEKQEFLANIHSNTQNINIIKEDLQNINIIKEDIQNIIEILFQNNIKELTKEMIKVSDAIKANRLIIIPLLMILSLQIFSSFYEILITPNVNVILLELRFIIEDIIRIFIIISVFEIKTSKMQILLINILLSYISCYMFFPLYIKLIERAGVINIIYYSVYIIINNLIINLLIFSTKIMKLTHMSLNAYILISSMDNILDFIDLYKTRFESSIDVFDLALNNILIIETLIIISIRNTLKKDGDLIFSNSLLIIHMMMFLIRYYFN